MEKIDQILESLYDRVIEPMEAKQQLLDLIIAKPCDHEKTYMHPDKCMTEGCPNCIF